MNADVTGSQADIGYHECYIFDPLAKAILAGKFGAGDTVQVDYPTK